MLPELHDNPEFSKNVFNFLKEVLKNVETKRPFRGPEIFIEYPFYYYDHSFGDITNFKGTEKIFYPYGEELVSEAFRQDYIGGLIIHK